jgi:hypothetical protein
MIWIYLAIGRLIEFLSNEPLAYVAECKTYITITRPHLTVERLMYISTPTIVTDAVIIFVQF